MSDGNTFLLLVRMAFSLALVLGILFVAARWVSRRQGIMPGRSQVSVPVAVLARQSLSRTASVHVVRIGSEILVLGVTDGQVTRLSSVDPEDSELIVQTEGVSPDPASEGHVVGGQAAASGEPQDRTGFAAALTGALGGTDRYGRAAASQSALARLVASTVRGGSPQGRGKHRG